MDRKYYKRFGTFQVDEVKPAGWLKEQLEVQMKGLSGKLYKLWDSTGSYSGWLGGTGEDWERGPYYLDGLLPLSYLVGDKERWELSERFVKWTLSSQDGDGNFGPCGSKHDWWSRVVMLKVLVQYYEITKDREVPVFMHRYFRYQLKELPGNPLRQWGKARGGDLLFCIKWLYELEPEPYLEDLMDLVHGQSLDFNEFFREFPFTRPTEYYYDWDKLSMFSWQTITAMMRFQETHIVNITMGLKFPALTAWLENNEGLGSLQKKAIEELVRYHGVVSGAVNGDEHLAGNSPSRGAELCSVVEYMFSLQILLEIFGDAEYGDLLEKLAYNALPATIAEDYEGHQYLQQANQVLVTNEKRNWFNNLEDSNLFGLEPNFGCCTANMHQGWPKFLKSLWYQDESSVVSAVFAPCRLETIRGGKPFTVELKTNYPSDGTLYYRVEEAGDGMARLLVRKPGWCKSWQIECNGSSRECWEEQGYLVAAKKLSKGDVIKVWFDMEPELSSWKNDSVGIQRGPLVYALDIQEEWSVFREMAGVRDYEIRPLSDWNYALVRDGKLVAEEKYVTGIPFQKKAPPVVIEAEARKLADWKIENGSAGEVPQSPVVTDKGLEKIRLIPFGCTKLRIAQFPYCVK